MPNIPGNSSLNPGVYSNTTVTPRGVAVNTGNRVAVIMGTGETQFEVIANAIGGAADGYNPTYTKLSTGYGRYFLLASGNDITPPYISGLTKLYKNGSLMTGIEQAVVVGESFPSQYQYRFDPVKGQIELQAATIEDQGGSLYKFTAITPGVTKAGASLSNLTLVNVNSPPETWYVRCISVNYLSGNPVLGTAKFIAIGSKSGQKYDSNGNAYVWDTSATIKDNGVISFYIVEDSVIPFKPGDQFSVIIDSQLLNAGDNLTATCVPQSFINDPVTYNSLNDIYKYHGLPSLDNTLSLGCQMAIENGAASVMSIQTAPPLPIRTRVDLAASPTPLINKYNPAAGNPNSSVAYNRNDFVFPLPSTFTPSTNYDVHLFQVDSSGVQTQVLANKYTGTALNNSTIDGFIQSTTTYENQYAFIQSNATVVSDNDGQITRKASGTRYQATFSSSVTFDSSYIGRWIKILDSNNAANKDYVSSNPGSFEITSGSVKNGSIVLDLGLTNPSGFQQPFVAGAVSYILLDSSGNQITQYLTGTGPNTYATLPALTGTISVLSSDTGTLVSSALATALSASTISPTLASQITQIKVTTVGSDNLGTYDAVVAGSNLTLSKCFVTESDLRFEIVESDANIKSYYFILNQACIPNGNYAWINVVSNELASFVDIGWEKAFTELEKVNCDVVVALPNETITAIFQNNIAHCAKMSSLRYRKERVPFIGAITGLSVDNIAGNPPAYIAVEDIGKLEGIQGSDIGGLLSGEDISNYDVPTAYGNVSRLAYMYPSKITKTLVKTAEVTELDGYFMCAALAGYVTGSNLIQEPTTNKNLVGFTIPRSESLSPSQLEALAGAGVMTLVSAGNNAAKIIWGLTTTQSGVPELQELSILFIRDAVSKNFRLLFDRFIGTAEKAETIIDLSTVAKDGLNSFSTQGWITQYRNLTVARDPVEPRQWNVGVEVQPTYGINWIYISTKVSYIGNS